MTVSDIINLATCEVGYTEKSSKKSDLDVFAGDGALNNYTKYARDLKTAGYYNGGKNGYKWCTIFVDWLVYKCCGSKTRAIEHKPNGIYGASCTWTKKYYKAAGKLGYEPAPGAQVFFKNKANETIHTGLVVGVTDTQIIVIEGNTSAGKVERKVYSRNYKYIDSYGYITYDTDTELKPGDKVKLLTEWYSNGKHIAASVRKREYVYVISANDQTVSISKYTSLAYTGKVNRKDVEKY